MKADKADNIAHRDYVLMNNDLESPVFYSSYSIIESERMIITKYRSESHHLNLLVVDTTPLVIVDSANAVPFIK